MKKVLSRIAAGLLSLMLVMGAVAGTDLGVHSVWAAAKTVNTANAPQNVSVYMYGDLHVGETAQLGISTYPEAAITSFTFKSSDTKVAAVDKHGRVTGLSTGKTTITVTTSNGIKSTYTLVVNKGEGVLTYKKTADGKGYRIVGCSTDAFTVNIPASYKKLPVTEIDPNAFTDCKNLRSFTTDKKQKTFYTDDGILYTDSPVKTLVRFPNNYGISMYSPEKPSYQVLEGTKEIGPYAFAGLQALDNLYLPEGLTTIGDYAFSKVETQVSLYMPNSVSSIADTILVNQRSNVPFFVKDRDSYASEFANSHSIPCGLVFDYEPLEETVTRAKPKAASGKKYTVPKASDIVNVQSPYASWELSDISLKQDFDISAEEKLGKKEVRILLQYSWRAIIPDEKGKWYSAFPKQTGVYGAGYTAKKATLVGYDLNGKVTGTYSVKGNFMFSLPGAVNIAVSGGKDTKLTCLPYKPVFVESAGAVNILPKELYILPNGKGVQFFVVGLERTSMSLAFPGYKNTRSYLFANVGGGQEETSPYFSVISIYENDPVKLWDKDYASICLDSMQELYSSDSFLCVAKASFGLNKTYGKKAAEIFEALKKTMIGTYYPSKGLAPKASIMVNGKYPSAFETNVDLDEYCLDIEDPSTIRTLAHELTHAIDQNIEATSVIAPSPWFEGRAEYIGDLVTTGMGLESQLYYDNMDWSFLSQEEKDNFFDYYYYSTNRNTTYSVGYLFHKYLCDTYGEKVTSKIMLRISKTCTADDRWYMSEDKKAALFKECVTAETSKNVFQDFVRDVIDK